MLCHIDNCNGYHYHAYCVQDNSVFDTVCGNNNNNNNSSAACSAAVTSFMANSVCNDGLTSDISRQNATALYCSTSGTCYTVTRAFRTACRGTSDNVSFCNIFVL